MHPSQMESTVQPEETEEHTEEEVVVAVPVAPLAERAEQVERVVLVVWEQSTFCAGEVGLVSRTSSYEEQKFEGFSRWPGLRNAHTMKI